MNPPSAPRKRQASSSPSASGKSSAAKRARVEDVERKLQSAINRLLRACGIVLNWPAALSKPEDIDDAADVAQDWDLFLRTYPDWSMSEYERVKKRMMMTKSKITPGMCVLKFGRQTY
jgi:hypothetical protein